MPSLLIVSTFCILLFGCALICKADKSSGLKPGENEWFFEDPTLSFKKGWAERNGLPCDYNYNNRGEPTKEGEKQLNEKLAEDGKKE
ncbi:hypothetical protein niasHS_008104 [Heterodera schachtii]|uniref:Gland protein n=1 Tax=Heterodera schachtii TaxID=97005 RepID=A0ABD2JA43_HETSC